MPYLCKSTDVGLIVMDIKNKKSQIFFFLIMLLGFLTNPVTAQDPYWQRVISNLSGEKTALAIGANGDIFVGTEFGIARSSDNGETWQDLKTGLPEKKIYELATSSSGYVFASVLGEGIYRSTNNGETWSKTNLGSAGLYLAYDIIVTNNEGHIFVPNRKGGGGIYRSIDNGDTWTLLPGPLLGRIYNYWVVSLAIKNNGYIFAGTAVSGVHRSTDNGDTWVQVNNGFEPNSIGQINVTLIMASGSGNIFTYAVRSLYRSMDNGVSWSLIDFFQDKRSVEAIAINENGYIFVLTNYDGLFHSIDNGESWVLVSDISSRVYRTDMITNNLGHIFINARKDNVGQHVLRSTDNGVSWDIVSDGLPVSNVPALAINSNGHILAGTVEGIFISLNRGHTWKPMGLETLYVSEIVINKAGHIFAGTSYNGLYRSTDNGETWLAMQVTNNRISSLHINNEEHVFAGAGIVLYRSSDNGDTWDVSLQERGSITALAFNNAGHAFAGANRKVLRSTDNGHTWRSVMTDDLNYGYVTALAISISGQIFAGTEHGGIFISNDDGDSWNNIKLPNGIVDDLLINSRGHIFAATSKGGVLFSRDNGDNWGPKNNGLSTPVTYLPIEAKKLVIDSSGNIFVSTRFGVFRSIEVTTSVKDITHRTPSAFKLEQNYPNPFNPSTTIQFEITQRSSVQLKVFDIGGKELTTLVNQVLSPGIYKRTFEAQGLPSGVYFYRIEAGNFSQTKKIILLK